ncbi:MAG: type transport system permease protein [Thermoproteota archaeon]|nr:type transport system permease protein [Thermoproteota archaeon]
MRQPNDLVTAIDSPVGNIVPTSVLQIGTITKYELLNYFRSRRFFILLGIAAAIAGILTFAVAYYGVATFGSTSLEFYSTWWGLSATFVIIFCAIFFGGDAISGEFQNKTGYFLVGNPIRRASIYIGKWFAALIASLIIFGIFTGITIGNGIYYFGTNIPIQFAESIACCLIYLISIIGFTFFFSALFKSSSMSILVTTILLLFGFNIISALVTNIAHEEPWFLLTYGAQIIGNVLTNPYPPHEVTVHFGPEGRVNFTSYNATVPEGLTIMAVYFIVTAALGLLLFERKEFN